MSLFQITTTKTTVQESFLHLFPADCRTVAGVGRHVEKHTSTTKLRRESECTVSGSGTLRYVQKQCSRHEYSPINISSHKARKHKSAYKRSPSISTLHRYSYSLCRAVEVGVGGSCVGAGVRDARNRTDRVLLPAYHLTATHQQRRCVAC